MATTDARQQTGERLKLRPAPSAAVEEAMEHLLAIWHEARRSGEQDGTAKRSLQERILTTACAATMTPSPPH
ncbi:hypothetical protein [Streptomyces narbonensis]|uniref:hypothetical protein n=1 Tax=Streptomyces narbonensis TaxID=67333 RepID=UPI0033D3FF80